MKPFAKLALMVCTTLLVVYVAINPQWGIVYQSPTAALGVGLIGMGLMIEARKRRKAA